MTLAHIRLALVFQTPSTARFAILGLIRPVQARLHQCSARSATLGRIRQDLALLHLHYVPFVSLAHTKQDQDCLCQSTAGFVTQVLTRLARE